MKRSCRHCARWSCHGRRQRSTRSWPAMKTWPHAYCGKCLILLAHAGAFVLSEVAFAQADALRRHLDQFVVIDEVERLFQAHDYGWLQAHGDFGSRGAHVGLLLL